MIEKRYTSNGKRQGWRCAICGETFKTLEDARIHMAIKHVLDFREAMGTVESVPAPKEFNPSER